MAVVASVLDLIGSTPLIDVSELSPNPNVRILGKAEFLNPAGSVKDRIARQMILEAEEDGTLRPGSVIIEPSSGNTGIALAMICRVRGYHLKVVLPENVTEERRAALLAFGAEVIDSPGAEGSNGAVRRALELSDQHPEWVFLYQYANEANPRAHYETTGPVIDSPGAEGSNGAVRRALELSDQHPEWVFLYQYANEANPRAHYETTGPEIATDCPEITHFVAGLGTSGTLLGVGTYLKELNPDVKVLAVEPPSGEQVEGLRSLDDGYIPPVFDKWGGVDLLDGKSIVRPRESLIWTRRLGDVGVFAGISSGAALAGAIKVAKRIEAGTIVFVICDGGWKYLSTGAYSGDLDAAAVKAEEIIYF